MSPPRRALLLAAAATVAAAVAATGCAIDDDGPRTSQTRDVAAFTRIDNADAVAVRVHVGEPQRVRARAGEKVVDDIHTSVRDGTLHISFDHHGIGDPDPVVDVSVPRLSGVDASGSGDVTADGIDADAFDVRPTARPTPPCRARPAACGSTWTARATRTSAFSAPGWRRWPSADPATSSMTATRR